MGKRSAVVELLLGNMGSMQWETRPSMQREDQPTMATKLEQIAVKARREPNLRFTSLAHHITRASRVLKNVQKIPQHSAAGVDGQTVEGAKESFEEWIGPMLELHPPPRISGAEHPAHLYPQAWQDGKASPWGADHL